MKLTPNVSDLQAVGHNIFDPSQSAQGAKKVRTIYSNSFMGYASKNWEAFNESEVRGFAGSYGSNSSVFDFLYIDFEGNCDYNNGTAWRNFAILVQQLIINNPNSFVCFWLIRPNFRAVNGTVQLGADQFSIFDNNGQYNGQSAATHAAILAGTLEIVPGVWTNQHSETGGKSLAQLLNAHSSGFGYYDWAGYSIALDELSVLSRFEQYKKVFPNAQIFSLDWVRVETSGFVNYHFETSKGRFRVFDKLPYPPSVITALTFWQFWKSKGVYMWEGKPAISQNVDVWADYKGYQYLPSFQESGANYSPNVSVPDNEYHLGPDGECYDAYQNGAFLYSQVQAIGDTGALTLPAFEFQRETRDVNGSSMWGAFQTVTQPATGAIYANAMANSLPIVELKTSVNSYVLVMQDCFPINGNKTRIKVNVGGSVQTFELKSNEIYIDKNF